MGNRTSTNRLGVVDGSTQTGYTPNRLNQITSSTRIDNGISSTSALSYDQSGNLTNETYGSGGSVYTYDDADRLTSIVRKTSAGVNDLKSEFVYDGFSRKVLSHEYSWDAATSAWVKMSDVRRIYDGMDVVREVDGTRVVDAQGVVTWSYKTINYTRDGNIGGLLAKTDAGSNSSLFYHYDGSDNVSQLTDVGQNTVATYEYDAYGRTLSFSGVQASSNPYRYQTKEQHQASGLYDYGFRFYSPSSGRWINRDPIREMGGLNLYGAFGNDPVNFSDAYGLDFFYYGTGFTKAEQALLTRLQKQMTTGGLGFLVPHLQWKCKWDLGTDSNGSPTRALTRKGFGNFGNLTTLDDRFFIDNNGGSRLETLIHEALHAYAGAYTTGGDSEAHDRVYLFAAFFERQITMGRFSRENGTRKKVFRAKVPKNLYRVIREGEKPIY